MQSCYFKSSNIIYLLSLYLLISSCATIVGTPFQLVSLNSSPDGAKITITDEAGKMSFSGITPTAVTLPKHNGQYFGGKDYKVTIEKTGYQPLTLDLKTRITGWYLAGNIFLNLFSWVGLLIVDPFNGGMYTLSPKAIDANLSKDHNKHASNMQSINICLLEDVPEHLHSQLQPINQPVAK